MSGAPSLLPPDPPLADDPAPRPRERHITCEFCGCALAPNGDYLRLSDRAKELRAQGETIDGLKEQLSLKDAETGEALRLLDEARADIARLSAPEKKRALW
jgi:hypothetical protein